MTSLDDFTIKHRAATQAIGAMPDGETKAAIMAYLDELTQRARDSIANATRASEIVRKVETWLRQATREQVDTKKLLVAAMRLDATLQDPLDAELAAAIYDPSGTEAEKFDRIKQAALTFLGNYHAMKGTVAAIVPLATALEKAADTNEEAVKGLSDSLK